MTESLRSAGGDSPAGQDANAVYPLGSSAEESARLQRQADELAPDSAALLDRVGLRPGQVAIDLVGSMRPQIMQLGLADEKEFDAMDAATRAHIEDPRTVVMSGLLSLRRGAGPHRRGPGEVQEWRKMGSWVLRLVIPQQIGRGSGWH